MLGNFINDMPDLAVLILRVYIAILMHTHGLPKLGILLSGEVNFPRLFDLSPTISLTMSVFAEVFCYILLIFRIATRLATIPLMFTMIIAVLVIHGDKPFSKKNLVYFS